MTLSAQHLGRFSPAIVLVAAYAFYSGAEAQQVYKCGNTYSQTPCEGGKAMEGQDKRTQEQKAQADKTTRDSEKAIKKLASERTQRDRSEAAQLRKDRAAQEADADKKKVQRAPFVPHFGKKFKPEKAADPAKPSKPAKPAKPAKAAKALVTSAR